LKVAIVHEWLDQYAGSERVLAQLIQCFPQADIFAVVDFLPEAERGFLAGRKVTTSFIQKLPFARKHFRKFLQLMPLAVEQFDLTNYQLVISSSHAVAKGVLTGPKQVHISYVHSPMRYAWDLQGQYLRETGTETGLKGLYVRWLLHRLRIWDSRTAAGVDVFIANSSYIARRIEKVYRRRALVIAPPVAVQDFVPGVGKREGFLIVSRQAPYKRVDLVIQAFKNMPRHRLTVIGAGTDHREVVQAAAGAPNITFRQPVGHAELITLMQTTRAVLFAAEEDFGITTVEAQACGTPVIAYGEGGIRDIIRPGAGDAMTGVLFKEQSPEAIIDAVAAFEAVENKISPEACRQNAMRFTEAQFREKIMQAADQALAEHRLV
jgi:glycosyltransferase involved in cell wall biosynthesis